MEVSIRYTVERDDVGTIEVPDGASHDEITAAAMDSIRNRIAAGEYGTRGGAIIRRAHWTADNGTFGGKG